MTAMSTAVPALTSRSNQISDGYVGCIAVGSVACTIAVVCVALRFIQQRRNWGIWWDDWTCLASLILCLGFLATVVIYATVGHVGYHINTYSIDQLETIFKIGIALEAMYSSTVSMSKFSVLLLYHRVFSVASRPNLYWKILVFLVAGYWISFTLCLLFGYSPVYALWQPWLPHTSINEKSFFISFCIIDTLLDISILALPQANVWKLQLSRRRKFLVSLVFLLGGFACISSIARLCYVATYDEADVTYDLTRAVLWSLLESSVSVICSCLPVVYKLFRGSESKESKASTNTASYYRRLPRRYGHYADASSAPTSANSGQALNESDGYRYHSGDNGHWVDIGSPNHVYIHQDFRVGRPC